jgi:hypothetical protein
MGGGELDCARHAAKRTPVMRMNSVSWQHAVVVTLSLAAAPFTVCAQPAEHATRYRLTETVSNTREVVGVSQSPPQIITTTMHVAIRTRLIGDTVHTEVTVDSTRVTAPGIDRLLPATNGATYVVATRPNTRVREAFRSASGDQSALSELTRIAKLVPLRPTNGTAWDTLDLTTAVPRPTTVQFDIRQFTPASDSSIGGIAVRSIVMRGTSKLSDSGSMRLGDQPVVSVGSGDMTGRWYLAANHEIQYARIEETFRRKITVGSAAQEVTRVSNTRLELERVRDP